ncbi:MAG: hypothetical protein PHV32_03430 [Eubacteriales bacterium]|nr:hypothetical protein [Eubacteriales bacterium]
MACIIVSFVLLLCGLENSIRKQEIELDIVYSTMPIHIEVSDIKGTNRNNLFLCGTEIDVFTSEVYDLSIYIKDICFKRTLAIQEFEDNKQITGNNGIKFYLIGITRVEAEEGLEQKRGVSIELQEGFTDNMLLETSNYCLANERLLQLLGKEPGDSILLTVKSPVNYFSREEPKEVKTELIIAGVIKGGDFNTMYCSWNKASLLGSESDYSNIWYTERIRATLRDNHRLSEFKQKAKRYYTSVDITAAKTEYRYALTVYDSIFMKTVFQIQKNIQFLKIILPIILLFSLGIGLLTSYLFTRNRQQELAVMRSLGTSKMKIMAIVLVEQSAISIVGILLGLLISRFLLKFNVLIINMLLFFISYIVGVVLFGYKITSGNVMKILRVKE